MLKLLEYINSLSKDEHNYNSIYNIFTSDKFNLSIKDNGDLYMLYFNKESDLTSTIIRECNGIILEKETNKLVHYCFSKTYNTTDDKYGAIDEVKDFKVGKFIDGCLIKVYWYNDKWNYGTSRTFDAKNVYCGEITYYDMFKECWDDTESLNKEHCYTFIMQHPCFDSVYQNNDKRVYLVSEYNVIKQRYVKQDIIEQDNSFVSLKEFDTVTDNYIIYLENGEKIKVLSKEFLFKLKAKEVNVCNFYLDNFNDNEIIDKLNKLFPEYKDIFIEIDRSFNRLKKIIHNAYVNIYIKKNKEFYIKKDLKRTLVQLHGIHKSTKKYICLETVHYHLLTLNKFLLQKFLKLV